MHFLIQKMSWSGAQRGLVMKTFFEEGESSVHTQQKKDEEITITGDAILADRYTSLKWIEMFMPTGSTIHASRVQQGRLKMWRQYNSLYCSHGNVPHEIMQLLLNYQSILKEFSIWVWNSSLTRWWWYRNWFCVIFKIAVPDVKFCQMSFRELLFCFSGMMSILIYQIISTNKTALLVASNLLELWNVCVVYDIYWQRLLGSIFLTRITGPLQPSHLTAASTRMSRSFVEPNLNDREDLQDEEI